MHKAQTCPTSSSLPVRPATPHTKVTRGRSLSKWLRAMLAFMQLASAVSAATIGIVRPQFAPLVGDTLGPWARQAAQALDAALAPAAAMADTFTGSNTLTITKQVNGTEPAGQTYSITVDGPSFTAPSTTLYTNGQTKVITGLIGGVYTVVITDPIPSATSYVLGSAQPAGTFSNNTLRWTVPSLQPGEVVRFTFQLRVEFVGERGAIVNVGYVSADGSSTPIPNPPRVVSNDDATVPVTPTAVTLVTFKATWAADAADGVNVAWETGSEINTFGFSLYRSTTGRREDAVLVTPELIPSQSVNNGGARYRFDDTTAVATPGVTYTYWLVETETTGKVNEYGPVNTDGLEIHGSVFQHLFLPVLLR